MKECRLTKKGETLNIINNNINNDYAKDVSMVNVHLYSQDQQGICQNPKLKIFLRVTK